MKQLIILMLALSAMALSACDAVPFLAQPTPTKTATKVPTLTPRPTATFTPVPTATPTAVPTPANPGDSLTKAFSGWRNVKSFRAQMTTTPKTGLVTQTMIEAVMPDRFHMVADKLEAIMIGTTFYMKTGTTWIKAALPKGFDFSFADVKKLEAELKATTTTKFIGADLLDAKPVLVYEYTTTIKGPPVVTTVTRVWVGVVDQLPLKMESTTSTGSKTVVLYSDYNADIKIEAPIK